MDGGIYFCRPFFGTNYIITQKTAEKILPFKKLKAKSQQLMAYY